MYVLKVINNTFFKQSTEQSKALSADAKVPVTPGITYNVKAYSIEDDSNHLKFTLNTEIKGRNTWYVFGKDVELWDNSRLVFPLKREIRLAVPFYRQTDNAFEAERTCNTSCCAMVAKFLGANISGDDEYYQYVIKYGDTTDHGVQTKALRDIGIKSQWHTDLDFADLDNSLNQGKPIVLGILHRGSIANPKGGHMIVCIGKTAKGYIFNDPYGSLLDGYRSDPGKGKGVVYDFDELKARWLLNQRKTGWGRTFL